MSNNSRFKRVVLPPGFNVFAAPVGPILDPTTGTVTLPPAVPVNNYPTTLRVLGRIESESLGPIHIHNPITRFALPPGIVQWIFPKNAEGLLRINWDAVEEIVVKLNKTIRRYDGQPTFIMERIQTMFRPPESHRSIHHAPAAWRSGAPMQNTFYQRIYNMTPRYVSISKEVEFEVPHISFRPGTEEEELRFEDYAKSEFELCRFIPTSSTTGEVHIYEGVADHVVIEALIRILTDYEAKRRVLNILLKNKVGISNIIKENIGSFLVGNRHRNATKKKPLRHDPGGGSMQNRRR